VLTIANVEQAAAWDGPEGEHWTAHAERYDRAVRRAWQRFMSRGLIGSRDRVLDIGCGTGTTTLDAGRVAAGGSALGADLSAAMLERARHRAAAAGLSNVTFVQADAQVHPFEDAAYDIAISRFGAMFFGDPVAAFTNIGRSLRPGGRLAMLAWRALSRNEWILAVRGALAAGRSLPEPPANAPGPFGLADADHVRSVLGRSGFEEVDLDSIDEPLDLGRTAEEAYDFVREMGVVQGLTQDLDGPARARTQEALRATLAAHAAPDGVLLGSSAWLITARRR
jgi:SAM-dependent methyltransferase